MRSKKDKIAYAGEHTFLPEEPKTPHEEVMFVVESTNEIVSEYNSCLIRMMEKIESTNDIVSKILEIEQKKDRDRERMLKYLESDKK